MFVALVGMLTGIVGTTTGVIAYYTSQEVQDIEHRLRANEHLDRAQDALQLYPDRIITYIPQPTSSEMDVAEREIRDALTIAPKYRRARIFEALHLSLSLNQQDSGVADSKFEEILRASPQSPETRLYYSLHLIHQERYDEAVPLIQAGLAQDPDHLQLRTNLALCYLETNQQGTALDILREVVRDSDRQYAPALVNFAVALLWQQEFAQAEAVCERAAELQPDHPEILRHLGVSKFYNGRLQEAEDALRSSLRLNPRAEVALVANENLRQVLLEQRAYDEAAEVAQLLDARENRNHLIQEALGGGAATQP